MSSRANISPEERQQTSAAWVARLHSGEMTADDEANLNEWLDADSANRREYGRSLQLWADMDPLRDDPAIRQLLSAPIHVAPERPNRWKSRGTLSALAATLAIVFVGTASYLYRSPGDQQVRTAVGEIRGVTLADGSNVTLNTATRLLVRMNETARTVEFEQGEAFFDVRADAARPFIVRTPNGDVRVIGTRFNLRRTGSLVEVMVEDGRVEVRPGSHAQAASIQLAARQRVAFAARGATSRPVVVPATSRIASWRSGDVIFRRDTLISVISELGRYTSKRLVIDDPQLANLAVSGVFRPHGREGDVEGFVVGLQAALPLRATVFADHISIEAAH